MFKFGTHVFVLLMFLSLVCGLYKKHAPLLFFKMSGHKIGSTSTRFATSPTYFKTLDKVSECCVEEKKSKFYAKAFPISSVEEAMSHIAKEKSVHPKASHHCWGIRLFDGQNAYSRMSDDGEPSGTAGKPIIAAIEGEDVYNCCVVVSRFFGGTLLGTGGLVRSYGAAARNALRGANFITVFPSVKLKIITPATESNLVYKEMSKVEGKQAKKLWENFVEEGTVESCWLLPSSYVEALSKSLCDLTRGKALIEVVAD